MTNDCHGNIVGCHTGAFLGLLRLQVTILVFDDDSLYLNFLHVFCPI